jgi:hypothetical protein
MPISSNAELHGYAIDLAARLDDARAAHAAHDGRSNQRYLVLSACWRDARSLAKRLESIARQPRRNHGHGSALLAAQQGDDDPPKAA